MQGFPLLVRLLNGFWAGIGEGTGQWSRPRTLGLPIREDPGAGVLSARSAGVPVARGGGGDHTGGGAVHSLKCLLGASRCQAPPGLGRTGGWMSVHPVRTSPVLRLHSPWEVGKVLIINTAKELIKIIH